MARRLRVLLHRQGDESDEDSLFSAAVRCQYTSAVTALEGLFDRVTYLARYLRQTVDWVWALDPEEADLYDASVSKLLKAEHGKTPDATGGPMLPHQDPWGFGDYDG